MRCLWFENLVVDAMSNEACCLLKANMSGDAISRLLCAGVFTRICEQKMPLGSSSREVCLQLQSMCKHSLPLFLFCLRLRVKRLMQGCGPLRV
jgi:hypothetical protein